MTATEERPEATIAARRESMPLWKQVAYVLFVLGFGVAVQLLAQGPGLITPWRLVIPNLSSGYETETNSLKSCRNDAVNIMQGAGPRSAYYCVRQCWWLERELRPSHVTIVGDRCKVVEAGA